MKDDIKNDIEEDLDNSQEFDSTTFLEKKQRELVSSTIDYNLESLSQLINNKTIDLWPDYQRRFRWGEDRKSKLIESFLMNIPIPPVFLNEDDYGKYSVIDGKQRLSAINDFLNGKFELKKLEVFSDLNGQKFADLPISFQNSLKTRANIRAVIILRQSDREIKYEVFQRLNTGGVELNAQEIRNSVFHGKFNDKIIELSESKLFHQLLGIKNKARSKIYQEMKDTELVLRFSSLKDNWRSYSGGLKIILDTFMEVSNKNMSDENIDNIERDFKETLEKVNIVFGPNSSFRRWMPQNNKWKQQVSVPLFDSQMLACYNKDKESLARHKENILADFKSLFEEDKDFIESIESSTATPRRFIYRTNKMEEIIKHYI